MPRFFYGRVFLICRFLAFVLVFFSVGCASEKPQAEGGGVSPEESAPPPSIFPHPEGWENAVVHGSSATLYGLPACLGCHPQSGGNPEGAPACQSCHLLFPHSPDWVGRDNHGAWVVQNSRASCATQCHGSDLGGGLTGVSCNLCHTIYPHSATWVGPSVHGDLARGNGKNLCRGCHGENLSGRGSAVSCYRCHTDYPHADNWEEQGQHGATAASQGEARCATQCHGTDLSGGLSGVSCNTCHSLYPHSDRWSERGNHGAFVIETGAESCRSCHGDDLRRVVGGRNCYSCHADYPHPARAVWTTFSGGHGESVQVAHGRSTATCKRCHGNNLREAKNGETCFTCHPSYPHNEGVTADPWNQFAGHGQYTLSHSRTECELCHGSNYQGGGRSNPSCYTSTCHVSYPHLSGWGSSDPADPQEHGNYVNANSRRSCATERCHGVDLAPTTGVTRGNPCNSCHGANYPHPAGWEGGIQHGPVARGNIALCKTCHGTGLDTAPPGSQSCFQCHPSYLQHRTAEMGVAGWGTYEGHGTYVGPRSSRNLTECQICHGTDFAGGVSGVSCSTCHQTFPHTSDWGDEARHGNYVRTSVGVYIDEIVPRCGNCHGADLTGGRSETSCYSCHPNYPHPRRGWITPARPGSHTRPFLESATSVSDDSRCWDCHDQPVPFTMTQTRENLRAESSCYNCHWSYPHTGWNTEATGQAWEPVVTSTCGDRGLTNMGHILYLTNNPDLFFRRNPTTGAEEHVPSSTSGSSPLWREAVEYTCGGWFTGVCHYEGLRSYNLGFPIPLCGQYCHNSTLDPPPPLPACPPPPPPPPPPDCGIAAFYDYATGMCCDVDDFTICWSPP